MISTISFIVVVIVVSLILIKKSDNEYVINYLFIPSLIWDLIYILLVVATYTYIFIVYKRQKNFERIQMATRKVNLSFWYLP